MDQLFSWSLLIASGTRDFEGRRLLNIQRPFQDVKIRKIGDTPWPNVDRMLTECWPNLESNVPESWFRIFHTLEQVVGVHRFASIFMLWASRAYSRDAFSTSREIASFLTLQRSSFLNTLSSCDDVQIAKDRIAVRRTTNANSGSASLARRVLRDHFWRKEA